MVSASAAAKKSGVAERTHYRWRREYGDLRTDQAKRREMLEQENVDLNILGGHDQMAHGGGGVFQIRSDRTGNATYRSSLTYPTNIIKLSPM